ncbi:MAG: acetylglutamate kinase [Gemmatimonadaceae bacterium]
MSADVMPMVRVIKIGGRAQGDARLPAALALAVESGVSVCVVHGGGDEVSQLQRQLGSEPTFRDGRRVTTASDLAVVRMVLSGTVNKRLVGDFLGAGVAAAGVSGEDGGLLLCRQFGSGELGEVGEPERVDPSLLRVLLAGGFIPVVSPLGRFADGNGCNVNGDDAAAAIAAALGADELLLVADVAGVLNESGVVLGTVDADESESLVTNGTARGGMIAKLEAARRAIAAGVKRVRIGDLTAIADQTAGTVIVPARQTAHQIR